ncbi:MAG: hypothetical protein ACREMR_07475 [Gemmatimonadales bacterium]
MTLGRLIFAWLPVAVWFALVPVVRSALARRVSQTPGAGHLTPGASPGIPLAWRAAEAGVVTLFASLWFDSLGHGGWWLVFLLVGLLAGFAARVSQLSGGAPEPRRPAIVDGLIDTARYIVAGGILAWRLG